MTQRPNMLSWRGKRFAHFPLSEIKRALLSIPDFIVERNS